MKRDTLNPFPAVGSELKDDALAAITGGFTAVTVAGLGGISDDWCGTPWPRKPIPPRKELLEFSLPAVLTVQV